MNIQKALNTTDDLIDQEIEIANLLRNGQLANSVAKTILASHTRILAALKFNLDVKKVGVIPEAVPLTDRKRQELADRLAAH